MCFSEQASFTAAAVLTLISVFSFKAVRNNPKYYALASIPLFFGLQQAAEGVQWLQFKGHWGTLEEASLARNIYVFFAFCFWPAWIPISFYSAESETKSKKWLLLLSLAGSAFALYMAAHAFPSISVPHERSIYYETAIVYNALYPYIILVTLPWFFSTLPKMTIIGILFTFALFLAAYIYQATFLSVWCFFAALVSLLIYSSLKTALKNK